jgi:hypothetical protein
MPMSQNLKEHKNRHFHTRYDQAPSERKNHVYQTIQISLIHPHRHKGEVLHMGIHQEIIMRHLLRDTSCFFKMICMNLYAYPEDVCPDLLL